MTVAMGYTASRQKRMGAGTHGAQLTFRNNLAAWYRFRTGIIAVDGKCSQWNDASNNSRPLLQASASLRPVVTSNGALTFDGVDDYMQATFTLAQPLTIYMAFRQVTWTQNDVIYDGATGNVRLTQATNTPEITANAGSSLTADATIPVVGMGASVFVANGTSSVYQAAGGAASVTTTGDAGANSAGGFTLGASRTPGSYSNIIVREVIIYSVAHDAPTRLQVLRYMARVANLGGV